MADPIPVEFVARLFDEARTHRNWTERPVPDDLLRTIYDHMRWGPTGFNTQPLRIVFIRTPEGKARLEPTLDAPNVERCMPAPVNAILAYDLQFWENLDRLSDRLGPRMRHRLSEETEYLVETAFRSSSLQAAYMIIIARAYGLDCYPMQGFDPGMVNREFFPDGRYRANMLLHLGYADPSLVRPRMPRLEFDETCSFA